MDDTAIIEAVNSFKGKYGQIPPMYSAIKVNGRKLYDLARQGIEIQREPRQVEISEIKVIDIKRRDGVVAVRFDVDCSKGTYVRTLCHDIGQRLGCGAHMSFLIRTRVGPFPLTEGITLEEINDRLEKGTLSSVIRPVDILFNDYNRVVVEGRALPGFLNGAPVVLHKFTTLKNNEAVRVYAETGAFLGLGRILVRGNKMILRPDKLFVSGV
ncbi:tRNA pseudouridine(55) synthase TruB [Thermoclostridium stercorarium]|nr:tRNA pseudouridine(55) synthase TruB [Thermoclostridium stercorarium]UZQ86615.1 tRNA pseudouridine(55) synthase TruB [Thermoclostridium stercorarium]